MTHFQNESLTNCSGLHLLKLLQVDHTDHCLQHVWERQQDQFANLIKRFIKRNWCKIMISNIYSFGLVCTFMLEMITEKSQWNVMTLLWNSPVVCKKGMIIIISSSSSSRSSIFFIYFFMLNHWISDQFTNGSFRSYSYRLNFAEFAWDFMTIPVDDDFANCFNGLTKNNYFKRQIQSEILHTPFFQLHVLYVFLLQKCHPFSRPDLYVYGYRNPADKIT